jgi:hypothetical protein
MSLAIHEHLRSQDNPAEQTKIGAEVLSVSGTRAPAPASETDPRWAKEAAQARAQLQSVGRVIDSGPSSGTPGHDTLRSQNMH